MWPVFANTTRIGWFRASCVGRVMQNARQKLPLYTQDERVSSPFDRITPGLILLGIGKPR